MDVRLDVNGRAAEEQITYLYKLSGLQSPQFTPFTEKHYSFCWGRSRSSFGTT